MGAGLGLGSELGLRLRLRLGFGLEFEPGLGSGLGPGLEGVMCVPSRCVRHPSAAKRRAYLVRVSGQG